MNNMVLELIGTKGVINCIYKAGSAGTNRVVDFKTISSIRYVIETFTIAFFPSAIFDATDYLEI